MEYKIFYNLEMKPGEINICHLYQVHWNEALYTLDSYQSKNRMNHCEASWTKYLLDLLKLKLTKGYWIAMRRKLVTTWRDNQYIILVKGIAEIRLKDWLSQLQGEIIWLSQLQGEIIDRVGKWSHLTNWCSCTMLSFTCHQRGILQS